MPLALLVLVTALVYALHQDVWFWRTARPLVFGLPIGLFYHAAYTVAVSLFMWVLVRTRWPSHLEDANEPQRVSRASGGGISGVPASERGGGRDGAKPPAQ